MLVLLLAGTAMLGFVSRRLTPETIARQLTGAVAHASHGRYALSIGSVERDLRARRLVLNDVTLGPAPGVELTTAYRVTVASLRIEGIDVAAAIHGGRVARAAYLEAPHLEVRVDRHIPPPERPPPPRMPNDLVRGARRPFALGRLEIARGSVQYRERAKDGANFGRIGFEDMVGSVRNVTNQPARFAEGKACAFDVVFLLAGAGRASVHLETDLTSPVLDLRYGGTVGRMEARALNDLLLDLEGINIIGGIMDSTVFGLEVKDGVAEGKVGVLYHGLVVEIVDRTTHQQDFGKALATFVNRHLRMNEANPEREGQAPKVISVRAGRRPQDGFLRFMWQNVRTGVYQTVGIEPASPHDQSTLEERSP